MKKSIQDELRKQHAPGSHPRRRSVKRKAQAKQPQPAATSGEAVDKTKATKPAKKES